MPWLPRPSAAETTEIRLAPVRVAWWTDATVGALRGHLASTDAEERAYWTAALLREANTRDVWLFVTPDDVRAQWTRLQRYLGRSRRLWAYLLGLEAGTWPPDAASRA